jgi:hypothetical protein
MIYLERFWCLLEDFEKKIGPLKNIVGNCVIFTRFLFCRLDMFKLLAQKYNAKSDITDSQTQSGSKRCVWIVAGTSNLVATVMKERVGEMMMMMMMMHKKHLEAQPLTNRCVQLIAIHIN